MERYIFPICSANRLGGIDDEDDGKGASGGGYILAGGTGNTLLSLEIRINDQAG